MKSALISLVALALLSAPPAAADAGLLAFDASMAPILQSYLQAHEALANDTTKGVQAAAKRISDLSADLKGATVAGEHATHYRQLPERIGRAAATLAAATDLATARAAFKELSKPMAMWGTMSKPAAVDVVFCSMARGSWLQSEGAVRNPYYGAKMLRCGQVVGGARHAAGATTAEAKAHTDGRM